MTSRWKGYMVATSQGKQEDGNMNHLEIGYTPGITAERSTYDIYEYSNRPVVGRQMVGRVGWGQTYDEAVRLAVYVGLAKMIPVR